MSLVKSLLPILGFKTANPSSIHVRRPLPPTLGGFPGEADIFYYVKATIQRLPWKGNQRSYVPFTLLPIEPPRPPDSGTEIYGRQQHQFNSPPASTTIGSKLEGIFKIKIEKSTTSAQEGTAPLVSVDARLPRPSILTCGKTVPLRIIVRKLNACPKVPYVDSLQVSLVGRTVIRAHKVFRTESNSWILESRSSMRDSIGKKSDPVGTENEVLSLRDAIPNTVPPSFRACNITRTYQLEVRIGLGCRAEFMAEVSKGSILFLFQIRKALIRRAPNLRAMH